jgi:hypothetical protein
VPVRPGLGLYTKRRTPRLLTYMTRTRERVKLTQARLILLQRVHLSREWAQLKGQPRQADTLLICIARSRARLKVEVCERMLGQHY